MDHKPTSIIALVGMAGSGKSVASEHFSLKGFPVLRFGDQTDLGLKNLGLPLTEKNESQYRENLRKKLGMAAYAKKIKPRIDKALKKSSVVILDGLYSWEEYEYLFNKYNNFFLVCIFAKPNIRYQRLANRSIRPLSRDEARKRDIREIVYSHKGGPIAISDFLIINHQTQEHLHHELDQVLAEIKLLKK